MGLYKANDITIVTCDCGDWYGLYINEKLFTEGHDISMSDWTELIEEYKSFSGSVETRYMSDEHMEDLGGMPRDIRDIPEEYYHEV